MATTTKKTTKSSKHTSAKGKKGGSSTMIAAGAGAVLGAAIGAGAAVAMSDTKTRKKIGKTVSTVSDYAADTLDTMNENTYDAIGMEDAVITSTQPTARKKSHTKN